MKGNDMAKTLIAGVTGGFACQCVLALLTFIVTPFVVRTLGNQLYGVYALVGFVISYFAFLEFGAGAAATKYAAQFLAQDNDSRLVKTVWTAAALLFAAGIFSVAAVFILSGWLAKLLAVPDAILAVTKTALLIGSCGFALTMLSGLTTGLMRALGLFNKLNVLNLIIGTATLASTVIMLKLGFSVPGIMLSAVCIQFASVMWQWQMCLAARPSLRHPQTDFGEFKNLFSYGMYLTLSGLLGPILSNIEKIFLARFASVAELTFYSVPFSLIDRLNLIPSSFSSVLFPSFSYLQDDKNRRAALFYRGTLYILFIYGLFTAFFIALGKPFLTAWMGADFAAKSASVLAILAAGGLVNAAARPAINALQGMGRPDLPFYFHLSETILYVPAVWVLTKKWGINGAACAWTLRVALDSLLLHIAAARLTGTNAALYFVMAGRFLPAVVAAGVLFYVSGAVGGSMLNPLFMGAVIVSALAYGAAAWQLGLDDKARDKFLNLMRVKR